MRHFAKKNFWLITTVLLSICLLMGAADPNDIKITDTQVRQLDARIDALEQNLAMTRGRLAHLEERAELRFTNIENKIAHMPASSSPSTSRRTSQPRERVMRPLPKNQNSFDQQRRDNPSPNVRVTRPIN